MKYILTIMLIATCSFASWFSTEYWVIASKEINDPVIIQMKMESRDEAIRYAQQLKSSGQYGAVNVGVGPCRLEGGINGIYVCKDIIFRYVNW
jgi:hypothetical protein